MSGGGKRENNERARGKKFLLHLWKAKGGGKRIDYLINMIGESSPFLAEKSDLIGERELIDLTDKPKRQEGNRQAVGERFQKGALPQGWTSEEETDTLSRMKGADKPRRGRRCKEEKKSLPFSGKRKHAFFRGEY